MSYQGQLLVQNFPTAGILPLINAANPWKLGKNITIQLETVK